MAQPAAAKSSAGGFPSAGNFSRQASELRRDKKQGCTTDYVKRQYIGNLGKIENGIVVVTAYGVIEDMTFPLTFQIYKPPERLQPGDKYKTQPEIAAELIREFQGMGFKFELVLADSLYGCIEKLMGISLVY